MAITAKFTTYDGTPKMINKNVSFGGSSVTVNAYEEIDDLTCNFILDGSGYHGVNYMEVSFPNHTKYYFIEKRSGMPGNMTRITAKCDVLYTYKTAIESAPAILARTQNTEFVNQLLKDNRKTTISKIVLSSKEEAEITSNQEYFYVCVAQSKKSRASAEE